VPTSHATTSPTTDDGLDARRVDGAARREDEFVDAWSSLKPLGYRLGAGTPVLLRDRERPSVFRSFGPWPDLESIERFRAELRPRLSRLQELLQSFEAFTLDEVQVDE